LDGSTEGHTSIYNISLNRSTEEGHTSIYNISLQNIIYIFRKELGMPISAPKTKHCAGFNELYTKDSRHIFFQSILNKRTFGTLQHVQVADINFHLGGLYSSLCGRVYILTLLRNAEGSKLQRNA
jgi:hypothetical protein